MTEDEIKAETKSRYKFYGCLAAFIGAVSVGGSILQLSERAESQENLENELAPLIQQNLKAHFDAINIDPQQLPSHYVAPWADASSRSGMVVFTGHKGENGCNVYSIQINKPPNRYEQDFKREICLKLGH